QPLPAITSPVTIDGISQGGAGYNGPPLIELRGPGGSFVVNGLNITAGSSTVKGLIINRFNPCIRIDTNGGNTIAGNYIGTDATGTVDMGSTIDGIVILTANNTIGGTTAAARNIISGNNSSGIFITGVPATGNLVQGNYIGTDVTGTNDLGNGVGVTITNAPNNTVGGTAAGARNIISGNDGNGVSLNQNSASGNQVQGNYIGTDASGTVALSNSLDGINLNAAPNTTIGGTVA